MNELKEFVLDYFKANNAKILESRKQITIQVPKRLFTKLNCEQILNITFDKDLAEKNPDIDFIAIGSALLNKILESCEKRGLTVVKQYKGKKKFEGLEFNFRVTFESVDKKEKLISYLIDLKNKTFNDKLMKELWKVDNKKFNSLTEIEEDIKKIDKEIDNIVYQLYNITSEEIKIIEEGV